jgi:hypothetical protein
MKETKFRQEFTVGNGREFNGGDIFVFETLYQRYTTEYLPFLPEVAAKIETRCTVDKQILLESASTGIGNQLTVDYTMKYTSQYYDVTTYPKLFQNWTNSNLNVLLGHMQSLKFNVTQIGTAKRILIATPAPTASFAPSTVPTAFPTISFDPTLTSSDEPFTTADNTEIPTIYPTVQVQQEPDRSSFGVIYIAVALHLAGLMLAIGIFLYCKNVRCARSGGFYSKGAMADRGHGRRYP